MKLTTLIENTAINEHLAVEHGLSLSIQTRKRHILFDTGASDAFLRNARTLGIDLTSVDTLVLSHGHYDHGGGLEPFLKINQKATLLLQEEAFSNLVAQGDPPQDIGLNAALKNHPRIERVKEYRELGEGIFVFSGVQQRQSTPLSNAGLMKVDQGTLIADPFHHEQNLVIEENNTRLLLCGCAHNGIQNILRHHRDLAGRDPDIVVGGFHLSGRQGTEPTEHLDRLAEDLLKTTAKFYTCHCTGQEAYRYLKQRMGDRLEYLAGGTQLIF